MLKRLFKNTYSTISLHIHLSTNMNRLDIAVQINVDIDGKIILSWLRLRALNFVSLINYCLEDWENQYILQKKTSFNLFEVFFLLIQSLIEGIVFQYSDKFFIL